MTRSGPQPRPAPERFWAKVDRRGPDECWPWVGARSSKGYGVFYRGSEALRPRMIFASRFSWIVHSGPIPDGLFVLHSCDNPPCCNPSHLFLGTRGDNNRDAIAKGRRRNQLTPALIDQVRRLRADGLTIPNTAATLGISPSNVDRSIRRLEDVAS